jgi:hypothetical protein
MRRFLPTAGLVALVLAGCGSGGAIEGTLAWKSGPVVGSHSVNGSVRNTTSHSVALNPKSMRLLDAGGRKVKGRISAGSDPLPAHASTILRATWKSGKPVRIDYGSGALALPSR